MNNLPNRKITLTISIVALVALTAWGVFSIVDSWGKTAKINITSTVPDDISVTVDGKGVASTTQVRVKPGHHTLKADRKGFASQTISIDVKDGETKSYELILTINGPEGEDWARKHPDKFTAYEAKAGEQYNKHVQVTTKEQPLIKVLPEVHPTWRIDYSRSVAHPNDPNALAITITYASDTAKNLALQWIRDQGFNPGDYEIVYKRPSAGVDD